MCQYKAMIPKAENVVSSHLRTLLEGLIPGEHLQDSEELHMVLGGLERVVPHILQETYDEWRGESFDEIYLANSSKIGVREAKFAGMCLLISDQCLTPIQIRLKVAEDADEIVSLECHVGEQTGDGMLRIPYSSSVWKKYLWAFNADSIPWTYVVNYERVL